MAKRKYDIFISYRRDGGINSAVALHSTLLQMNYRAFLDVNNLQSGKFDEALYDVIDHCTDFLLVLSPHALDRCADKEDWVRKEVERALQMNKNIIPIICDGGDVKALFTDAVPEDMKELLRYNVLKADVVQLQAMTALLRTNLRSRPAAAPQKQLLWVLIGALLCAALAFGGYQLHRHLNTFPRSDREKNLVEEVISAQMFNLTAFDLAQAEYLKALNKAEAYVAGNTNDTRAALSSEMNLHMELIHQQLENIRPISADLMDRVSASPIPAADLSAQPEYIRSTTETMFENLMYLENFLIDDETTLKSDKIQWIRIYREMALLENDMMFYALNASLISVEEKALITLKADILPTLTTVYSKHQPWQNNEAELKGYEKSLLNQYEKQTDALQSLSEQSARILAHEKELQQLRIDTKADMLKQKQEEYLKLKNELAEKKNTYYQANKPRVTDDADLLWGKALRFLKLSMPEAAIECFTMYTMVETDPDLRLCGENASRFVQYMPQTHITGGVIVALFEEGKAQQPGLEIGDIIYSVNGKDIFTFEDYIAAKDGNNTSSLAIMRFTPAGYELMKTELDPSCGLIGLYSLNESPAE